MTGLSDSKQPETILERKIIKRGDAATTKLLVKWKGYPVEAATWEFYQDLIAKYPDIDS